MDNLTHFPFFINDFIGDTHYMTPAEVGAYIRLIVWHYQLGPQGLPDDDSQIMRRVGFRRGAHWERIRQVVMAKFHKDPSSGRLVHYNVCSGHKKITTMRSLYKDNSLKRWRAKDATALPRQSDGNAIQTQTQSQRTPKAPTPPTPPAGRGGGGEFADKSAGKGGVSKREKCLKSETIKPATTPDSEAETVTHNGRNIPKRIGNAVWDDAKGSYVMADSGEAIFADEDTNSPAEVEAPPAGERFSINAHLDGGAVQAAREAAPGWDMGYLMAKYDEGINSGQRERPKAPAKAFPAWCQRYTKGKRP